MNRPNVLLIAEGSGGHLIPALEVATALSKAGATTKVWYAQRAATAPLAGALAASASQAAVEVDPIPLQRCASLAGRLWACGQLWRRATRCFDTFAPDIVVGFGGWVSAPVVLAARLRGKVDSPGSGRPGNRRMIPCLLHEQNVQLGRANRLLTRWVDQVAVSFAQTESMVQGRPTVMTGMPVRPAIASGSREHAAHRFGLDLQRPTVLVLGGSQGARALNRLLCEAVACWTPAQRHTYQLIHLTGQRDERMVRDLHANHGVSAWVAPYLVEMQQAYAMADMAVARSGASTVAELAQCGIPALLIPYPHAAGHQRANAHVVAAAGGGFVIEESQATPARLTDTIQRVLDDPTLRRRMGEQMRSLHSAGAAERLTHMILALAASPHTRIVWS